MLDSVSSQPGQPDRQIRLFQDISSPENLSRRCGDVAGPETGMDIILRTTTRRWGPGHVEAQCRVESAETHQYSRLVSIEDASLNETTRTKEAVKAFARLETVDRRATRLADLAATCKLPAVSKMQITMTQCHHVGQFLS
jgi:hypothetical protein